MESFLLSVIIILILFFYFQKQNKKLLQYNKDLEEKLRQKEEEMDSMISLYDQNVIASKTDLRGKITYASTKFSQTSGFSKEELVGQPHNIVRHPDTPKELYKDLWETIQNDKVWEGEIFNKTKSGDAYWVSTIITPEFDKEGRKIGYSSVRHNITAKKELEKLSETLEKKVEERTRELEELAITDGLTKLYNRRYFEIILEKEFHRAKRNKTSFVFTIFDVDKFKQYNDTYGHIRGDKVLIKLASILKDSTQRANDFAFRIGGEEFCIITSAMSEEEALGYLEKIRTAIEDEKIEHKKSTVSEYVTASFGLVVVNFDKMTHTVFDKRYEIENIYKQADKLLYDAKANGRNCIVHEVI